MPILITGINGFLGMELARTLSNESDIVGVGRTRNLNIPGCRYFSIDITDSQTVSALFKEFQFDTVFHFASLTSHAEIVDKKNESLRINVLGTLNLLNAFEETQGKRFIFASSGKVYGKMTTTGLSEDNSKAEPSNILGQSKLITENIIRFFASSSAAKYTICRIFNVYGPGQRDSFIVPTILKQLKESPNLFLGNLQDGRDYIYIQDLIKAVTLLYKTEQKKSFDVFNIGSGTATTVNQILSELSKIISTDFKVHTDPKKLRFDEYSEEYADLTKIRSVGWSPKVDLRTGLEFCVRKDASELLK